MNQDIQSIISSIPSLIPGTVAFLLVVIAFVIIRRVIFYRILKLNSHELLAAIADQINKIGWETIIVTGCYISLNFFPEVSGNLYRILYFLFIVVWSWQAIQFAIRSITFFIDNMIARSEEGNVSAYRFLGSTLKVLVWIIVALLIMSNLGYDVSSLVAGLGISGIAVALAVQSVLGDFISSLSIVADKPFRVGDVIVVNDYIGEVKKIGVRSTLVRSLDGENLIMPNSELVKTIVRNYGKVHQRRSLHTLGVVYDTDPRLVKDIPVFIYDIYSSNKKVAEERRRANFVGYGDSSLNFEIAFEIIADTYEEYLNIQEQVLFEIMDKFKAEGIQFAFPTQTVLLSKD